MDTRLERSNDGGEGIDDRLRLLCAGRVQVGSHHICLWRVSNIEDSLHIYEAPTDLRKNISKLFVQFLQ